LPAEQLSAVLHREFADMLVSESLTSFVDQIVAKLASTRANSNSSTNSSSTNNNNNTNNNKRALNDGTDAVDDDDDDDDERNEAEHDFKRSRTRTDERDSNRSSPPPVGAPGPGGVVDVQPLRRYEREREPRDRRDREPPRDARDWNHARGGAPMGAFPLGFQFGLPGNPLFNFRPLYGGGGPQPMAPYPQQWMPNHQPPHYQLQPHEPRRDDRDRQGRDRGGDRGGGQRDRAGPSSSSPSSSSSSQQQPSAKRGFGTHTDKSDPILADANLPTTLVLTRVPQNLNSLSQLMGHFSKFGEIEGIKCDKATDRATIEFRTRAGAQAAISSTDAVLNNRFIMVFWANREPPSEVGTRARAAPAQKLNALTKPGSNVLIVSAPANAAAGATATAGAGADAADGAAALERKQLELLKMRETVRQTQMSQQKQILSLVSRPGIADDEKAALMLKLKELSAAIEESLALEREAANTTAERVAVATATAVERANASRATANAAKVEAEAATQSSTATATTTTSTTATTAAVDPKFAAINAQLAALERQVLGVGGAAAAAASSPPAYGGRGRGRGASSWHSGGGRGRGGGAVGAPPRRMRLDLRGTTIVLSGASDNVAANEETVRTALAPYGGIVKNVLLGQPGGVVVDYETVHDAERVINAVNGATGAPFTARWNVAAAKAAESSNDAGAAAAGAAPVSDASFDAGVEVTEYKAGRETRDDEEGDDEDAWRR
jgi:hypothetical protein